MTTGSHRARTLFLCGVLHSFTHVYHVVLLPLYLPLQEGLRLPSVEEATLLQSILMIAYVVPSYGLGVLADRLNRKRLMSCGLLINALGILGLAVAPGYATAVASVVVAGIGGSFFHPAATALVVRLYPAGTGRALGLFGIGASVGFFAGPIYAGWRAGVAGWRAPLIELGAAGVLMAGVFAWLAEDESDPSAAGGRSQAVVPMFPAASLWAAFLGAGLLLGLRDFAGASVGSLSSLFLQQAHGYTLRETGLALSLVFLASAISNPLLGHLSDRGRLRAAAVVLLLAAVLVGLLPHLGAVWFPVGLAIYGFFFMASYPVIEAALMESVPDAVRGRVFGLFITMGGLIGNLSHWLVGRWAKTLGDSASQADSYRPVYLGLALLLVLSLGALPCLAGLRRAEVRLQPPPTSP